ncbi:MAG: LytTR family DNA-binding domain-containing protein [Bacteroidota bacterium]
MIRTIIIEDEKKSREVLHKLIQANCPQLNVTGLASSVEQAVEMIKKERPDLIFLDIELSDGTSFDILEQVQGMHFDVIFATAYDQYAIKAIKFSAIDYLLKPIDADELKKAVEKISSKKTELSQIENLRFLLQNFKRQDENFSKITLPTGNAYEIVSVSDIIRLEADESYTRVILTEKRNFLVTQTMKHFEDILPSDMFIRIHHSHLVNIKHVVRYLKVDSGYAVMSDGSQLEISRRKRDQFLEHLGKL